MLFGVGARFADEGWRSEIPNKELVRRLYESYRGLNVQFIHVRALSDEHSIGNENADMAIGPYASVIESFAGSVVK